MSYFLIFDSGCPTCNRVALEVQKIAEDRINVLSIREPQAQRLLDQALGPGWTFAPYLVRSCGDQVQSWAGLRASARLAVLLGPQRALRVWSTVRQTSRPAGTARRAFLRASGLLAISLPLLRFRVPEIERSARAQAGSTGELYEGFLLLPPDTAPPPPQTPVPAGALPSPEHLKSTSQATLLSQTMSDPAALAKSVNFPVYDLGQVPAPLRSGPINLVRSNGTKVVAALVTYQSPVTWQGRSLLATDVAILAQPVFPRPFPIFSTNKAAPGTRSVAPVKVSFLPAAGVAVSTLRGRVYHWIQNDVLYTLRVENGVSDPQADAIASTLTPVHA